MTKQSSKKNAKPFTNQDVPVKEIRKCLYERQFCPDDEIANVALSMAKGQVTPITVRELPKGGYELIAGWVRLQAAKRLKLETLEAKVYPSTLDNIEAMRILHAENVKVPLNDLDRAAQLQLFRREGKTETDIAEIVGWTQPNVHYYLSLLGYDDSIKAAVGRGDLHISHAREIAKLPEKKIMKETVKELSGQSYRKVKQAVAEKIKELEIVDRETTVKADIATEESKIRNVEKLEAEKSQLESSLDDAEKRLKKLEKKAPSDLNGLITKLSFIETEYLPAKLKLTELQGEVSELKKQIASMDEAKLQKAIDKLESGFNAKEEEVKALRAKLKTILDERDSFGAQLKDCHDTARTLKKAKDSLKVADGQKDKMEKFVEEKAKDYADELENFEDLKKSVTSYKTDIIDKRNALFKEVSVISERIRSLIGQINQRSKYEAKIKELSAELSAIQPQPKPEAKAKVAA